MVDNEGAWNWTEDCFIISSIMIKWMVKSMTMLQSS